MAQIASNLPPPKKKKKKKNGQCPNAGVMFHKSAPIIDLYQFINDTHPLRLEPGVLFPKVAELSLRGVFFILIISIIPFS